jgi:hypothetical protein
MICIYFLKLKEQNELQSASVLGRAEDELSLLIHFCTSKGGSAPDWLLLTKRPTWRLHQASGISQFRESPSVFLALVSLYKFGVAAHLIPSNSSFFKSSHPKPTPHFSQPHIIPSSNHLHDATDKYNQSTLIILSFLRDHLLPHPCLPHFSYILRSPTGFEIRFRATLA